MNSSLTNLMDVLQAQFCYQLFITPFHVPLVFEYRELANRGKEYIEEQRTSVIHHDSPRHYVLHCFKPNNVSNGKKVLVTHGWLSRAAYMVRFIRALQLQGFEVYAIDFPAHGEAKGAQLPWTDAIRILRDVLNEHGPFYGAVGHSFGGSMMLSTINLSQQLPELSLDHTPDRLILISSPTRMRTPMFRLAKTLKLTPSGYRHFRQLLIEQADIDPRRLRLRNFLEQQHDIPILCIHGAQDDTIPPQESKLFCQKYPYGELAILPDADHINVLIDERVEQLVCEFMTKATKQI